MTGEQNKAQRLSHWENNLIQFLMWKLSQMDPKQELRHLDLGVFPWNGQIELSALYVQDMPESSPAAYLAEIANWPHYALGKLTLTGPEASSLMTDMQNDYQQNPDSKFDYFQAAGRAMNSSYVINCLNNLNLSDDFAKSVLDPDNPAQNFV